MEIIAVGIVLLFFYLFIRVCTKVFAWLGGTGHGAYQTVANRYRGRLESRSGGAPTVTFQHNGATIRVGLAPAGPGGPRTRVVARFARGVPFRMEIYPQLRPSPPPTPRGTRAAWSRDSGFNQRYTILANDEGIAAEFLDADVRGMIDSLRLIAPPTGTYLSVIPERILIQVDRQLAKATDDLLEMVSHALRLHDRLLIAIDAQIRRGVEIVDDIKVQVEEVGSPVCKVCGETIEGRRMVCSACRTPHHQDCWEFVGGCTVYGCQCKRPIVEDVLPQRR